MRSWEFKGEQQFLSLLYESNRFNVAVCLFSNRSQVESDCGKNKKEAQKAQTSVLLMQKNGEF